ncbi:hypothetical protein LXL04_034572 [Taraxacum kok-saghyz]
MFFGSSSIISADLQRPSSSVCVFFQNQASLADSIFAASIFPIEPITLCLLLPDRLNHSWTTQLHFAYCNDLLPEMMRVMYGERGGNLFATADRYCVDNGAMIAYTGLLAFAHERVTPFEESFLLVLEV